MDVDATLLPAHWERLALSEVAACAPVCRLPWPQLKARGIEVAIKREELLDSRLGGNKFYKLFFHLRAMRKLGLSQALSFGGAYSNHLYALAAAGKAQNFATVGVVRGEPGIRLSPTLEDLQRMGMRLLFVSRSVYRNKSSPTLLHWLKEQVGPFYSIPEGGGGALGAKGCRTWAEVAIESCPFEPTHIAVACGTGTTLAGLLAARQGIPVIGVLALKGSPAQADALAAESRCLAREISGGQSPADLRLVTGYHCGGYARYPDYLASFVAEFEAANAVELDPVYTAKLCWGIAALVEQGELPCGSRLLLLHSGGLQGKRGFCSR